MYAPVCTPLGPPVDPRLAPGDPRRLATAASPPLSPSRFVACVVAGLHAGSSSSSLSKVTCSFFAASVTAGATMATRTRVGLVAAVVASIAVADAWLTVQADRLPPPPPPPPLARSWDGDAAYWNRELSDTRESGPARPPRKRSLSPGRRFSRSPRGASRSRSPRGRRRFSRSRSPRGRRGASRSRSPRGRHSSRTRGSRRDGSWTRTPYRCSRRSRSVDDRRPRRPSPRPSAAKKRSLSPPLQKRASAPRWRPTPRNVVPGDRFRVCLTEAARPGRDRIDLTVGPCDARRPHAPVRATIRTYKWRARGMLYPDPAGICLGVQGLSRLAEVAASLADAAEARRATALHVLQDEGPVCRQTAAAACVGGRWGVVLASQQLSRGMRRRRRHAFPGGDEPGFSWDRVDAARTLVLTAAEARFAAEFAPRAREALVQAYAEGEVPLYDA